MIPTSPVKTQKTTAINHSESLVQNRRKVTEEAKRKAAFSSRESKKRSHGYEIEKRIEGCRLTEEEIELKFVVGLV